ncbi:MAG: hypothetical protein CMN30_22495 [Sandaracinus sp.]|nr:hypothetical protein [Sandaracinus sp.]|tara:strand:- start:2269 stop:4119 length:1851 start_codon:yes stop_codon:yes gene_type:complete
MAEAAPRPAPSRWRAPVVLALVALGLAASYWASPIDPLQGDGFYTYLWARSLAYDFDLDLTNDYALCGDPWGMATPEAEGLGPRNQWNPGPAVVWTPMIWLGRAVHSLDGETRYGLGCDGPISEFALFGTAIMAFLAVWLTFRMARRHFGEGPALLAAVAVAFCTPLTYYGTWLASYGHAPAAFGAALFLERWDATRRGERVGRWALLGALLGFAMLMRPQSAIVVVAPLWEWLSAAGRAWPRAKDLARHVGRGVVFVVCIVVVFYPQLHAWRIAYGTFFAMPQGPHYMRWGEPSLDGVFFATTNGLLVWTPLLYLALGGFVPALRERRHRAVAAVFLVSLALTTYVNASVWDYWGSMGFSNRRFTSMAPIFGFGFAAAFAALHRRALAEPRRFIAGVAGVAVGAFTLWNFAAMSGVASGRLASWREQSSAEVWQGTFREASKGVWEAVGNPMSWPASLPFALRWRVHPRHYDAMRGMSLFYAEYQDRAPRRGEETARFATTPLHQLYAVEGFDDPESIEGRRALPASGDARLLVPFFIEDYEAVTLDWQGAAGETVIVRWDGRKVAQLRFSGEWQTVRVAIPEAARHPGVTEIRFETQHPWALQSMTVEAFGVSE